MTDWTPEMDAAITRGHQDGLSARLIAESIGGGVTRNSVLGRTFRLGLCQSGSERRKPETSAKRPKKETLLQISIRQRTRPADVIDRITDMLELGLGWREIAAEIGMSIATVRGWAIKFGGYAPRHMTRFTDEDRAYITAAWARHDLVEDIADKLGRSFGVVRQEILRLRRGGHIETRDPNKTRLLRQYGEAALAAGATPAEALKKMAEAKEAAFSEARDAAASAKRKYRDQVLTALRASVAAGADRNACIFAARADGVSLEEIGAEFGLTRERIRQICNAYAQEVALRNLSVPAGLSSAGQAA